MTSVDRKKHVAKLLGVHPSRLRRFSRLELDAQPKLKMSPSGWYIQSTDGWELACVSHRKLQDSLANSFADLQLEDLVQL